MHVVIETSKEQMKADEISVFRLQTKPRGRCRGAFAFGQYAAAWEIGAKPVDLEKMLQTGNVTQSLNWSKAGGFGEDTPNRKCYLELELEQSRWIWRRYSKPEMLLRAEIGAKPVDLEKILQTGNVTQSWNWSKVGGFGEDAPNRKCYLELELEQSRWIWRRCSKPEMLLRA